MSTHRLIRFAPFALVLLLAASCGLAAAEEPAAPAPAENPPAAEAAPELEPPPPEPAAEEPAAEPPAPPAANEPPGNFPALLPAENQPPAPAPGVQEFVFPLPGADEPAPLPPAIVPGGPLMLNFRDASVSAVLEYLSEALGLVVVQDARVDGRITVLSYQPVSVDEAISLLDTVLRAKGLAAVRNGRTLKVVSIDQAKKELLPVRSGNDPGQVEPTDQIITQVIPIRYADAVKLKTDLAALVPAGADMTTNAASNALILTSTQANIRRIMEIIRAIDVHLSEVSQVKVFQLKNANATNAARLITEIFKQDQTSQQQGTPFGFGGRRAFMGPGGQQAQSDETGSRAVKVTASADERTNTLVVSAPPDVLKVIDDVVRELDANPAEAQAVFIYPVKNGTATNIAATLNTLFGWTTSGTTTSSRQTTTPFQSGTTGFGSTTSGARTSSGSTGTGRSRTTSTSSGRGTTGQGSRGTSPVATGAASDLTGQVYVVADADTNSLLVTTASKNFDRVKTILADLDRAVPQVLIKVLLAEATLNDGLDLGMEFSILNLRATGRGTTGGTDFGVANQIGSPTETGGLVSKVVETDVTAALRALATTAKLDVKSRPYILTSDNQLASIMVGAEVPRLTSSRITGESGQTVSTYDYDEVGIILNVTPHINPQGIVTLDVAPSITTLTGETVAVSETLKVPVKSKRAAQSRVAIRDGQTIVIGGLMEDRYTDTVDKVPLLGDIPLLGTLFRHTVKKQTKTELLIFLTPHVARRPDDLEGMSSDELSGSTGATGAMGKEVMDEHLKAMQRGAPARVAAPEDETPAPEPAKPTENEQNDAKE